MNATVPDITSFLHYAQARANALTTLLPDAWQAAFGDAAEITISRGTIRVDEYDCGY